MRYYFDTWDNDTSFVDKDGVDLPSLDAVKQEVAATLGGMARNALYSSGNRVLTIDVRDQDGRAVLESNLIFEVRELP